MTTVEDRMVGANRNVIAHIVDTHYAAWEVDKQRFHSRWSQNPHPSPKLVQKQLDVLVAARLGMLLDEVIQKTVAAVASCKSESPAEAAIEYFELHLTGWCKALENERREIVDLLCNATVAESGVYQIHNHLLSKAYRAVIEQQRCIQHPEDSPELRRRPRSVSAATSIAELEEGERRPDRKASIRSIPKTSPEIPLTALRDHRWEDIGIEFVAEDALRIKSLKVKKLFTRATYAELGFKDGRKGDMANNLWLMLKDIVSNNGVIDRKSSKCEHAPKGFSSFSSKNISLLSKALRKATGIKDKPFNPYIKKTNERYAARFRILNTEIPRLEVRVKIHRDATKK